MMLLDIAQSALKKAGWSLNVLTGPRIFATADNDMHSAISSQSQVRCYG